MVIYLIIAALFFLSFAQKKATDKKAAFIFTIPTIVIALSQGFIPGWVYYISCAIAAYIIILALLKINTKFSLSLSKAVFVSIILNVFGWTLWYFYLPADAYCSVFSLYYLWVAYLFADNGGLNWKTFLHGWRRSLGSLRCYFALLQK